MDGKNFDNLTRLNGTSRITNVFNGITLNSCSRIEQGHCLSRYEYVGCAKKHHYPRDNERVPAYVYRRSLVLTDSPSLSLSLSPPFTTLLSVAPRLLSLAPAIPVMYYLMRDARRNKFIAHRRVTSNGFLNMLPIDGFGLWKFKQRSNRSLTSIYRHEERKGGRLDSSACNLSPSKGSAFPAARFNPFFFYKK